MSSPPGTTFTCCNWLLALDAGAGFAAALAAGAGAPGSGLAEAGTPAASSAAFESLACFCCSDLATLRALSMASGFCANAAPAVMVIAVARMTVVSFIVSLLRRRRCRFCSGASRGRLRVVTEISRCRKGCDDALVRLIDIGVLRFGAVGILDRRDQEPADVDDALELAHAVEELQRRVIRTVQFHFERNF